jgi:hypothetical protein
MKTAEFLRRVLPWPGNDDNGFINFHYAGKFDDGKPWMSGQPTSTLQQFMQKVCEANSWKTPVDIYMCLSRQAKTRTKEDGKVRAAKHQEDALALKAIWLDVDVGKEGAYETRDEARQAISTLCATAGLPPPSAVVGSGGGLHVYWISNQPLTPAEWLPWADALKTVGLNTVIGLDKDPFKFDAMCTANSAQILRVPGTWNRKTHPPRPVELLELLDHDYDFGTHLAVLRAVNTGRSHIVASTDPALPGSPLPVFAALATESLGAGVGDKEMKPDLDLVATQCGFIKEALETGGANFGNPLWNLTTLIATSTKGGREDAHRMAQGHPTYDRVKTDELFERKVAERRNPRLGWPGCKAIQAAGCKHCAGCPHLAKGKSPLNLATRAAPPAEPSFVDPYEEFSGPPFPLDVLPPTLTSFVKAQGRAMGADPSALAMAALTTVAGAMHADTRIRVGDDWQERPIIWNVLVGDPSTMKSPGIYCATRPLVDLDTGRHKVWEAMYVQWKQANQDKKGGPKSPPPPRAPRFIINDATPEKIAEILSRGPDGSLMVQDEIAGWLGGFERYNSGASSRSFYLQCWNGGPHLKDRVGKGRNDEDAEIRVDNLALCILGGIQPDRLAELRDLTSDGLLQRFLPVLMQRASRGDQYHPVAEANMRYAELIRSISEAPPRNYRFAGDALAVRDRVFDNLHRLEGVDGLSSALIGAIGKLRGYFARICLVLHVAEQYDTTGLIENPEWPRAEGARLMKLFGINPATMGSLGAGIDTDEISRSTAERAEKLLNQFLLPHVFGFYDVVVNGGQDRDLVRSIGSFILASNKDRLRPSDITAGVRKL